MPLPCYSSAHTETVLTVVVTCIEDLYTVTFYLKLRNLNLSFIKITKYLYSKFESYLGNVKLDFTDYKAMKIIWIRLERKVKAFNSYEVLLVCKEC